MNSNYIIRNDLFFGMNQFYVKLIIEKWNLLFKDRSIDMYVLGLSFY